MKKAIPKSENITKHDQSADGLRGLAALVVVISHFICAFKPTLQSKFHPSIFEENLNPSLTERLVQLPPASLFFNGHFAVCIFFVLSGYVLSIPFFTDEKQKLRSRILGRYTRLNVPIAFATLVSFALLKLNLYSNHVAGKLSGSNWMASWFPSSEVNISSALKSAIASGIITGDGTFIPPLWTLKIEFIGSIALLTYLLISSRKSQFITAPIYAVILMAIYKQEAFYHFLFLAGAFLHYTNSFKGKWLALATILSIYLGSFSQQHFYSVLPKLTILVLPFTEMKVLWHGLGAIILVQCVRSGLLKKFLATKPSQFLGRVSFSLYLLHHLVLCSFASTLYISMPKNLPNMAFLFAAYLCTSILVSWFMYLSVDKFGIKCSHAFSRAVLS